MRLEELEKTLNYLKANHGAVEDKKKVPVLRDLKNFIRKNWNERHGEILRVVYEMNSREKYFDMEIFLFDCLRFPGSKPIERYKDGWLLDVCISEFPFNRDSYHDSEIDAIKTEDNNLVIDLDLVETWKRDQGNGFFQVGRRYEIRFLDFKFYRMESGLACPVSNTEIVNINNGTIMSFREVPLIGSYCRKYGIDVQEHVGNRLFVLETLYNDYSEFVILASEQKKKKVGNETINIGYAIVPKTGAAE